MFWFVTVAAAAADYDDHDGLVSVVSYCFLEFSTQSGLRGSSRIAL